MIPLAALAAVSTVAIALYMLTPTQMTSEMKKQTSKGTSSSASSISFPTSDEETGEVFKDTYNSLDELTQTILVSQTAGMSDVILEDSQRPPQNSVLIAKGVMKKRAVQVKGEVSVWQSPTERYVRFENFETHNGPNLHIILSTDLGIEDSVDLGQIIVTKGSANLYIGNTVDTKKYNHVLVWSRDFDVLFSYAILKEVK